MWNDLKAIADFPRYRFNRVSFSDCLSLAAQFRKELLNLLWINNIVDDCQRVGQLIGADCIYHSRFRNQDREVIHKKLIEGFSWGNGVFSGATTQTCETSLDLQNVQRIITVEAPINGLIQRSGRGGRDLHLKKSGLVEIYIYPRQNDLPYEEDDFQGLTDFLREVDGRIVSQSDLAELLIEYSPKDPDPLERVAFLESGAWANGKDQDLRDIKEFTVDAILEQDLNTYFKLKKDKKMVDGLYIPAPKKVVEWRDGLAIVPYSAKATYDTSRGLICY